MKTFLISLLWLATAHAAEPRGVSILWVLDNSASMKEQTRSLATALPSFVKKLEAGGVKDYDMAVTTADYFTDGGRLLASPLGNRVFSPKLADPMGELRDTMLAVKDSVTSFWEQGLESSRQAIAMDGKLFLRRDRQLAVIYVSDEDDYSCEENCFGVEPEHNTKWKPFPLDRYVAFFKNLEAQDGIQTRVYPIVGLLEGSCNVPSFGVRYVRLRSQLGGVAGSVCRAEVEESLYAVAKDLSTGSAGGPPIVITDPIHLPDAYVFSGGGLYSASLAQFVAGGGKLIFNKASGGDWLTLSSDGLLYGTPRKQDVGLHTILVNVCNPLGACARMNVKIRVETENQPPVWKQNPIDLGKIQKGSLVAFDLMGYVSDPLGGALTCSAPGLPSWMRLGSGCAVAGKPGPADVGTFHGVIRAANAKGLTADVNIVGRIE